MYSKANKVKISPFITFCMKFNGLIMWLPGQFLLLCDHLTVAKWLLWYLHSWIIFFLAEKNVSDNLPLKYPELLALADLKFLHSFSPKAKKCNDTYKYNQVVVLGDLWLYLSVWSLDHFFYLTRRT